MITAKTLYKVPKCNGKSSLSNFSVGIWCTENIECENMTLEEAIINSKCISGHIIDESIKNLLIFTFYDASNFGLEKDEFIEISYEDLIAECEPIEIVTYE